MADNHQKSVCQMRNRLLTEHQRLPPLAKCRQCDACTSVASLSSGLRTFWGLRKPITACEHLVLATFDSMLPEERLSWEADLMEPTIFRDTRHHLCACEQTLCGLESVVVLWTSCGRGGGLARAQRCVPYPFFLRLPKRVDLHFRR